MLISGTIPLHPPVGGGGRDKFTFFQTLAETISPQVFINNQRDVTFLISLFILYMFRTVLVHHQELYFVMYAGLTGMCGLCGVVSVTPSCR
jgi:hypothetical protein